MEPARHCTAVGHRLRAGLAGHRACIGIDYREVDRPPELFAQAYALARRHGLKTTAHAGEFGLPWTNVQTALDLLQVDRVDHGYTVVDAPDFAARCAARGIVFTVVPTNSYYLRTLAPERWALDHPIRRMPGLGLRIHPNTDDPTLHHVTPSGAWLMMVRDFGFGLADLRGFMLNGLDGAWIDDSTRRQWRAEFTQALDGLVAELDDCEPRSLAHVRTIPAAPSGAGGRGHAATPCAWLSERCRKPRPFPPERLKSWRDALLDEIGQGRCASSRGRFNPRGVKRKMSGFKVRHRGELLNQTHEPKPVIRI